MGPCSPRIQAVLWTGIVFAAMVALPLAGVQTARGQGTQGVNVDSLVAAAMDSAAAVGLSNTPAYKGAVIGNVTFVQMKNELTSTLTYGGATRMGAKLSLDKKKYRLQERFEDSKFLGANLSHHFNTRTALDFAFNDRRQFNRVFAVGGQVQDFILNDRSLTGGVGRKTLSASPLRWDGRAAGTLIDSEKTFKHDQTNSGSVNGGVGVTAEVAGAVITLSGRAAYKQTWESSTTLSGVDVFELESFQRGDVEDLGGAEDSVAARVAVQFNDSMTVVADYTDYSGTRSYADQARGSLGSQLVGEDNLIWEKETRTSQGISIVLDARPMRGLTMNVRSRHAVDGYDYATQLTRFSETTSDVIGADIRYQSFWGTGFTARMERSERARDFGPQSVGSFNEIGKSFAVEGSHQLTERTSLTAGYDTRLSQSFYIDPSNPRDRDQLDNAVTARLTSTLWENKIQTMVPFIWTRTDFVNIDQSQSANNRVKSRYDFRPRVTFTVNPRFAIEQEYWLALEFTDFDYNETDNSLDRTVAFSNQFRYQLTPDVSTKMVYRLELHDRGSYQPIVPGGERFFERDREDRRDRIELDLRYQMNAHLAAVVDYDYSQKTDRTLSTGAEQVTADGGIEGGVEGRYNWGPGRELRLVLKKANRFGPFNTAAQNDYWVANSELVYTF